MAFTLQEVNDALAVVHNGFDFTEVVKRLKRLGVLSYTYSLREGVFTFYGDNNHKLTTKTNGIHIEAEIAADSNPEAAQAAIDRHQAKTTNFETFCHEIAQTGVATWEVNLELLHVQYNGATGKAIIREQIPQFED